MRVKYKGKVDMNWKSIVTAFVKCLSVGASSATVAASSDTSTQVIAGLIAALATIWSTLSASKK